MSVTFTQWDVRTTGNDANGGGFNPGTSFACSGGTDYSQQDSPQVTFDGATITASTGGSSATITITGYTVATTDKCNVLQIASGTNFLPEFYAINSVNTGANTWTLDRNVSSGAGSAMVGRMGGSLLTIAKAYAATSLLMDTINLKNGTYTLTAAIAMPSGVQGVTLLGYNSTHADGPTGTNRPLITTATDSTKLFALTQNNGSKGTTFRDVRFSNTATTRDACIYSPTNGAYGPVMLDNVKMDGCKYAVQGDFNTDYYINGLFVINSEITNSTNAGIFNDGNTIVYYSYIHDNTGDGMGGSNCVGATWVISYSVFDTNSGDGITFCSGSAGPAAYPTSVDHSVFYNNGGDGIDSASDAPQVSITNSIFDSNGGYGINLPGATPNTTVVFTRNNAFRNNTTGTQTFGGITTGITTGNVTLTAIPWVDAPNGDFTLNSTAGGGAALKGTGYSGGTLFQPSAPATVDIGAVQTSGGSSGAGTTATAYVQ